jgi:small conductance mechanosensitive channel
MENFIKDISLKIKSYYGFLVAIMPKLILAIIVLTIFLTAMYYIRRIVIKGICKNTRDELLSDFLNKIFRTINILLGLTIFSYILGGTGIAAGFFGAAGISAFVIGFAFKDIGENFLAGIIMAINRPFSIGDIVSSQNIEGKIIGLTLRETILKTSDGKDVYIPNAQILKTAFFNHTVDGYLRQDFELITDLNIDIKAAIAIMIAEISFTEGVLNSYKKPSVTIKKLNIDSIEFKCNFWIDIHDKSVSTGEIKNSIIERIFASFREKSVYSYLNQTPKIFEDILGEQISTQKQDHDVE